MKPNGSLALSRAYGALRAALGGTRRERLHIPLRKRNKHGFNIPSTKKTLMPEVVDVVSGLFMREDKALLGLRKASGKRGGLWEMPGGKVDGAETHAAALCREWREELGVDIIDVGPRLATCVFDLEICFTVTLYVVQAVRGEPKPLDHTKLRWVSLDAAVQNWPCSPALYMHWPHVRTWLGTQTKT